MVAFITDGKMTERKPPFCCFQAHTIMLQWSEFGNSLRQIFVSVTVLYITDEGSHKLVKMSDNNKTFG